MLVDERRTDVLVVGGALAGLSAAASASEAGAETLVLSEGEPGQSGATHYANAYITGCHSSQIDSLVEQVLWTSGFLADPALVRTLAEDIEGAVEWLQGIGLTMEPVGDMNRPFGWKMQQLEGQPKGASIGRFLTEECKRLGVQMEGDTQALSLLKDDGGVRGALLWQSRQQCLLVVHASAVILATGGGARCFSRSDNPKGTVGDGFRLAVEAGASLIDMEMVNYNVPAVKTEAILRLGPTMIGSEGSAHYFCGGIRIDSDGWTGVPGLWAAGEVTGGVFGAARLGGTALADGLVFGRRAGKGAAHGLRSGNGFVDINALAASFPQEVSSDPAETRWLAETESRIGNTLWQHCGFVKSGERLLQGQEDIASILGSFGEHQPRSLEAMAKLAKISSMAVTGAAILTASLQRQESRGNFWRSDYPEPDLSQGLFRNVLHVENGVWQLTKETVDHPMPAWQGPIRLAPGCLSYDFAHENGR